MGYRVHTRLCRATGLPLLFRLARANVHDAPFARPLLEMAVRLLVLRPRVIRLDAGYWGLKLIAWIHLTLGALAVILWKPKGQKRRDGLPPAWTADESGKRTSIERFFGRDLVFFRLQRPPVFGWSAVATRVALTYASVWVFALAAWQEGRPHLIRSPRLVLAHVWEGVRSETRSNSTATLAFNLSTGLRFGPTMRCGVINRAMDSLAEHRTSDRYVLPHDRDDSARAT